MRMISNLSQRVAGLAMLACVIGCPPAFADYGQEAQEYLKRHAEYALEFDSVPLIVRQTTTNRDQALRDLLPIVTDVIGAKQPAYDVDSVLLERHGLLDKRGSTLPPNFKLTSEVDGMRLIESEDGTTLIRRKEFSLRVLNHGHAFRLVSHRNDYGKYDNAPAKIDEDEAESIGRSLIKQWGLVQPEELSQLAFLKTRYVHFTGRANDPEDRVVATTIHFGRKIEGVPVVGFHGSTIRIELIANGDVHSVDVDWTPIRTTEHQQSPLDLEGYHRRLTGLMMWRRIDGEKTDAPNDAIKVEISRQICGYFDAGAGRSDALLMQLGCMVASRTNGDSTPEVTFVPIGETVVPEDGWIYTHFIDEAERLADEGRLDIQLFTSGKH